MVKYIVNEWHADIDAKVGVLLYCVVVLCCAGRVATCMLHDVCTIIVLSLCDVPLFWCVGLRWQR